MTAFQSFSLDALHTLHEALEMLEEQRALTAEDWEQEGDPQHAAAHRHVQRVAGNLKQIVLDEFGRRKCP